MFKAYPTSVILQPYIAFFYSIKCQSSDYENKISEFWVPSGHAHMGFHLRDLFMCFKEIKNKNYQDTTMWGNKPSITILIRTRILLNSTVFPFQPSGLWHLFKPNMPSITNRAVTTNSLLEFNIKNSWKSLNQNNRQNQEYNFLKIF